MELEKELKQALFHNEYHKLSLNIIFTSNWIESAFAKFIKKYDLSHTQYNILRILRGQHPKAATVLMIQERMLDRMSNTSRLIEKLRLKGLVDRRECPVDRRQVDITITDDGLKLLSEIDLYVDDFNNRFSNVSLTEAEELNRILDKLRDNDTN